MIKLIHVGELFPVLFVINGLLFTELLKNMQKSVTKLSLWSLLFKDGKGAVYNG